MKPLGILALIALGLPFQISPGLGYGLCSTGICAIQGSSIGTINGVSTISLPIQTGTAGPKGDKGDTGPAGQPPLTLTGGVTVVVNQSWHVATISPSADGTYALPGAVNQVNSALDTVTHLGFDHSQYSKNGSVVTLQKPTGNPIEFVWIAAGN